MALKAYALTLDLRDKQHNYTDLFNAIKSLGEWKHPQEPLWVVIVDERKADANKIFDLIKPNMQPTDMVFITDISNMDRQGWMPSTTWEMLKSHSL